MDAVHGRPLARTDRRDPRHRPPHGVEALEPRAGVAQARARRRRRRVSAGGEEELADTLDRLLRAEAGRRAEMLADIAAREPARAAELRSLLAALPDPELIDGADVQDARELHGARETQAAREEPALGESIGGCVLESVLGRGGIGTVFAARQLEPPRAVAVKILRSERARPRDLVRFRAEAAALARLEHPAIARLYASGIEPRGARALPFIVMERVPDARDVIAWSRETHADARAIALQFALVCDALQHRHNRGIVRRDLKPSNILVDGEGRPRVIDFGIARLASSPEEGVHDAPRAVLIGTPAYMAPEQLGAADGRGNGAGDGARAPDEDLDARVDIHAIGLILYEALVGRRAYELPRDLAGPRALAAHPALAGRAPPAPRAVDSRIGADLSAIVMKAMAIDRERRYSSMGALADDLRAFADGRAVGARTDSPLERLARTTRRHPLALGAVAVAVLSLAASLAVSVVALDAARRRSVAAEMVTAMAAASEGDVREATAALERMDPSPHPVLAGMVARLLDDAAAEPVAPDIGHLVGGALSPDGTRVAVGGDGGQIAVVDLATGVFALARSGEKSFWATAFSRDGARVYAGSHAGEIVEIDVGALGDDPAAWPRTLEARRIAAIGGLVRGLAVSRDGARLLALSSPGVLSSITLADGAVASAPSIVSNGMARSLAWTGEGRAYVVGGAFALAAFEVPESGPPQRADPPWLASTAARAGATALSRDGSLLAVGEATGRLVVLDARTGAQRLVAELGHDIWSIDFAADGARVAAATRGGRVLELGIPAVGGGEPWRKSHGTLHHAPRGSRRSGPTDRLSRTWGSRSCDSGRALRGPRGPSRFRSVFRAHSRWSTATARRPRCGWPQATAASGISRSREARGRAPRIRSPRPREPSPSARAAPASPRGATRDLRSSRSSTGRASRRRFPRAGAASLRGTLRATNSRSSLRARSTSSRSTARCAPRAASSPPRTATTRATPRAARRSSLRASRRARSSRSTARARSLRGRPIRRAPCGSGGSTGAGSSRSCRERSSSRIGATRRRLAARSTTSRPPSSATPTRRTPLRSRPMAACLRAQAWTRASVSGTSSAPSASRPRRSARALSGFSSGSTAAARCLSSTRRGRCSCSTRFRAARASRRRPLPRPLSSRRDSRGPRRASSRRAC
ncbi:MAG: protein kinase [Phycisphaera sp.]|nr:protein kinase [Phycisphaera sp.]